MIIALFLLAVASALNSQHRIVRVWDQLTIFNGTTGEFVDSFNMTSFPYISGVTLPFLPHPSFSLRQT
jgi:hypothetical protein